MKLFLVARYGNNEEGPNGSDTLFLVRAPNHIRAAKAVDEDLATRKEPRISPTTNWICEIGLDSSEQKATAILKGPFFGLSGVDGYVSVWTRDSAQDKWISQKASIVAARRARTNNH